MAIPQTTGEVLVATQLHVAGYTNYAPQLLMLRALGVRATAERVGLLAPRRDGGVQMLSSVEALISAVAAELLRL